MAIRMRRGNEADFDPSKMLPGEWAVSTDTKYVRMCFSPGIVLRMATYEAFESDMAEIRKIFSECQSIQTAIELIQKNVTNSELVIENYVKEAKQYRDEAEQFRNEASMFAPEGYEDLVKNVSDNTVKIDTIIEKAELNIKNNAKGSNIHLTDSAESNVVSLELYGKTEQNAYTGKNLLDCSGLTETTTNGVKFTPVYDANGSLKYINANGTASANATFRIDKAESLKEGKYILNGCPVGGSNSTYRIRATRGLYGQDIGSGLTSNYTVGENLYIYIEIANGYTANNLKFYPMVSVEGGEYEPYVGGTPSPSPSYPQEIKSVKGKNLLDCRGLSEQTTNGITFTPVYDENGNLLYVNANGVSTNAYFKLGTVIYLYECVLNGCPIGHSSSSAMIFAQTTDGSKTYYDVGNGIKIPANTEMNIFVRIASGYTANNLKFYPMIRSASIKDDTYVPYGLLRIKTIGSQLVNVDNAQIGKAWNGDVNTARAVVIVPCKPNTTYTVNYDTTVVDGSYYFEKESKNDRIATANMPITGVTTITTSANSNFIVIQFNKENITINDVKNAKLMLNKGTIALPYQSYQSTEITLSEPIELNGFNGVYDVVTSEGVTRRFAEYTITGDENIYLHANGKIYVPIDSLYYKIKAQGELLCTIATNKQNNSTELNGYYCNLGTAGVYFTINDVFDTADDFINYVKSNTVKCLIELATPTTEALQSDFTALKTFYPETYVSNDADCDMSITYIADAKNYIDNKIALLTTAIYNNI